ncbi:MAG: hypothetical protein PHD01_12960 [Geobacteraceae bacterium]|nr:hypothetical protein [Geobacteraceae bacterium]
MEKKGLLMGKCFLTTIAVLIMAFILTSAIPVQQAYAEDESITVSCFKGNSEEGNYIGEISVNHLRDAASDCNQEFDGCHGDCLGCVTDSEDNQVCYDKNAEKVSQ